MHNNNNAAHVNQLVFLLIVPLINIEVRLLPSFLQTGFLQEGSLPTLVSHDAPHLEIMNS